MCAGGNLDAKLAYVNHASVNAHRDEITDKIISDVVLGRSLMFDVKYIGDILGLRVSLLGVVEEPELIIIHDLAFDASTTIRSSAHDETDFAQVPECKLGHVLHKQLHGVWLFCSCVKHILKITSCVEHILKITIGKCWSTLPVHLRSDIPVSYTHLTLPTILLV